MRILFCMTLGIIFGTVSSNTSTNSPANKDENTKDDVELSDGELSRIVAENPLDDPLNAFFDPYDPYRLSTFAYWHPITYPEEHQNPVLPLGFLPVNAMKCFPDDFFFNDKEAKKLVQSEHAAAFCPFLKRWRKKHPLKPYPLGPDFVQRHPPIKFVPGKGYEIDFELERIIRLSQKIEDGVLNRFTSPEPNPEVENIFDISIIETSPPVKKTNKVSQQKNKKKKKKKKKKRKKSLAKDPEIELELLLKIISEVRNYRPDCQSHSSFLTPIQERDLYFSSRPNCLLEAIFRVEEIEDTYAPVDTQYIYPEIANKFEYFRQILMRLYNGKELRRGKCPFGFGASTKSAKNSPKDPPKQSDESKTSKYPLIYQGTVPEWAKLEPGDLLFSSGEDSELEAAEKYLFPYKQVPFPSIQNTLKKYVSL